MIGYNWNYDITPCKCFVAKGDELKVNDCTCDPWWSTICLSVHTVLIKSSNIRPTFEYC